MACELSGGAICFGNIHIGLSHFGIAYGVGYSGHFYHGNVHVNVDPDGTQTLSFLNGQDYTSNRFATEYLDGVLEFRFRTNSNNNGRYTRLYIGGIIGYLTDSYSYFNSDAYRVKFITLVVLIQWRYGTYVKCGRGPFNLFYYFGLNPIVSSGVLIDRAGKRIKSELWIFHNIIAIQELQPRTFKKLFVVDYTSMLTLNPERSFYLRT